MKKINYIIITFVVIAVVAGLILLGMMDQKIPSTPTKPSFAVTPTPTPRATVSQSLKEILIKELPYETDDFLVEYYPKNDLFYVTIKGEAYHENYRKALRWFSDRQIPYPSNNAKIRFVFAGYREF